MLGVQLLAAAGNFLRQFDALECKPAQRERGAKPGPADAAVEQVGQRGRRLHSAARHADAAREQAECAAHAANTVPP